MAGRRDVIKAGLATLAGAQVASHLGCGKVEGQGQGQAAATAGRAAHDQAVPSTGERLAAIGVGTNNYSPTTAEERAARREVLAGLTAAGASVIDTAPAYRQSEEVDRGAAGGHRQSQAGIHRDQGHGARGQPREGRRDDRGVEAAPEDRRARSRADPQPQRRRGAVPASVRSQGRKRQIRYVGITTSSSSSTSDGRSHEVAADRFHPGRLSRWRIAPRRRQCCRPRSRNGSAC